MRIQFGPIPDELDLNVTTGSDWDGTLRYIVAGTPTNWPAGTVLELCFADGTTWAATFTGPDAVWSVDKAQVEARTHQEAAWLQYTNGTTDRRLWIGRVVRHG